MRRRQFLVAGLALAGAAWTDRPAFAATVQRARPGMPDWPSRADWDMLKRATGGRVSPVSLPDNLASPDAKTLLSNPFYLADQPGLAEHSGWLGAWRFSPSAYAVAAVRFAQAHNLRLVIKGRGHSFFGGSNAPDSLLIWTRRMDDVTVHAAFRPAG